MALNLEEVKLGEWFVVAATLMGPVLAVQAQKWIERASARRNRKLALFRALATNVTNITSWDAVQAINSIPIDFQPSRFLGVERTTDKERHVMAARGKFFEHANSSPADINSKEQWQNFNLKLNDLFVDMVIAVGRDLGYDLSAQELRYASYAPQAHAADQKEQREVRESLLQVLSGSREIAVRVIPHE